MPIKTQSDLPAKSILEHENIFVMDEFRAMHQDIRPLSICILNLMPVKEDTELQLLRSLCSGPLPVSRAALHLLQLGLQATPPLLTLLPRGLQAAKLRPQLRYFSLQSQAGLLPCAFALRWERDGSDL